MDIKVDAKSLPDIRKALAGFESEIPKAVAQSLTFTAERVQSDLSNMMHMVFDNPTRFTLNSVYKTSATVQSMTAQVRLKDEAAGGTPAAKYLQAQIVGGKRGMKGVERALQRNGFITGNQFLVPGDDAPLNSYGNLPRGQIVKALSNVKGQIDSTANTASAKAKARQKRSGKQYFWMPGKGIFWRQSKSLRSFLIVANKPDYQPRFDFFGIAQRSVAQHLPEQVQRSIDRVLRKAQEAGADQA